VRDRAKAFDHSLTELWLGDRSPPVARIQRILDTRSIRAGIVIGASMQTPTFHHYRELWQDKVCVNLAIRTFDPELPFSCVDQYMLVLDAIKELTRRGYTRPALLVTRQIEQWVDFRFHAAMLVGQKLMMRAPLIPEFTEFDDPPASGIPPTFRAWFDRHQPDSILTFFPEVRDWILAMDRRVPRDVGIVLMDRLPRGHDFAHMDQHMVTVGMNGVDLLASLLLARNGERPYTLIHNRASWVDGPTVREPVHSRENP
jgi:LacI family transcriptional regulator